MSCSTQRDNFLPGPLSPSYRPSTGVENDAPVTDLFFHNSFNTYRNHPFPFCIDLN